MHKLLTIIFPYRDRDTDRVDLSLQSLKEQTFKDFKVIFVDYGSQENYAKQVKETVNQFDFASYEYIGHRGLLWNKSKALNYAIKQATSDYVITADVDVLFAKDFIENALKLVNATTYSLFKIGYLSKEITEKQQIQLNLNSIETTYVGDTFGIGLFPKSVLEKIGGLDEFFHFYGSEDEDLNCRVELSGTKLNSCDKILLYHQWHPRYPQKKDNQLTQMPRLTNILRINQRHYLMHKDEQILHPNSKTWGICYDQKDSERLKLANIKIELDNISSHVIHFFGEKINRYKDSVIQVIVKEDPYFQSLKHNIKKQLGKQTQPYISMKEVNDLILKAILFRYRDHNYAYQISEDLKEISFTIDFNLNTDDAI